MENHLLVIVSATPSVARKEDKPQIRWSLIRLWPKYAEFDRLRPKPPKLGRTHRNIRSPHLKLGQAEPKSKRTHNNGVRTHLISVILRTT